MGKEVRSKPNDAFRIAQTLEDVGAEGWGVGTCKINAANDPPMMVGVSFWNVSGKGVIVLTYPDETVGLYTLQGEDGTPVEDDIAFLRSLAEKKGDPNNA